MKASAQLDKLALQPHHPLWPFALHLGFALLFMLVAALSYWPEPEVAFRTDESPVAWLSSAQMWALAVMSLHLWQERRLSNWLGLLLSSGMMLMAFDEQFMWHEHWKHGCQNWLAACRYETLRELPMLLVALGGVLVLRLLWRALQHRLSKGLLLCAIMLGWFALFLRFTQQPAFLLPYKAALLVLAQALFMGLLFSLSGASPSSQEHAAN